MNLAKILLPTLFILALSQAAQAQAPANGARPPQDVNVINEAAVAVTNAPTVHVASLPPLTIDMDSRLPYQKSLTADWTTSAVNLIVDVPPGHRFVIEHLSASVFMHSQVEFASMFIATDVNGSSGAHYFNLTETATGFEGSNTYVGSFPVRIYADQSFLARFFKVNAGGQGNAIEMGTASISVSGYLIPYTSPDLSP
jgi:hypothetical protein